MDKKRIWGVDIGSETVKVLVGMAENNGSVSIFDSGSAPTTGFVKGNVVDAAALAYAVKQAMDCVTVSADICPDDYIFLGIGGSLVKSREETVLFEKGDQNITSEEWNRYCREKVLATADASERVLHVLPRQFSGLKFGEFAKTENPGEAAGTRVHVVSTVAANMDPIEAALQNVGIRVDGIVANPVVGALQFFDGISRSETLQDLFLDVGAGTVDWAVYNRAIVASGSLPVGGEYITRDIMQGLGVSRLHAEGIKRYYSRLEHPERGQNILLDCNDYGTADKNIPYDFLYDIVESRVEEIAQLIEEHLTEQLPGDEAGTINRVFLSGGSSVLPSMGQQIEQVFTAPVQMVQPRRISAEYSRPGYMTSVGILQYAARHLPVRTSEGTGKWSSMLRSVQKIFRA